LAKLCNRLDIGAMHFAFLGFCKGRTNKLTSMEIKFLSNKFDFTENCVFILFLVEKEHSSQVANNGKIPRNRGKICKLRCFVLVFVFLWKRVENWSCSWEKRGEGRREREHREGKCESVFPLSRLLHQSMSIAFLFSGCTQ
jgi:hypothetical protein